MASRCTTITREGSQCKLKTYKTYKKCYLHSKVYIDVEDEPMISTKHEKYVYDDFCVPDDAPILYKKKRSKQ